MMKKQCFHPALAAFSLVGEDFTELKLEIKKFVSFNVFRVLQKTKIYI